MNMSITKKKMVFICILLFAVSGTLLLFSQEVKAVEATTWQNDYEFELDESDSEHPYINLKKYIGTATELTVPAKAIIVNDTYPEGKEFSTTIGTEAYVVSIYGDTKITSITFEEGVLAVQNLSYLFNHCQNLEYINMSGVDTSEVTKMDSMFFDCRKLVYLNLSGFDTSKVTKMSYMFGQCNSLPSLEISHFDTSNVTDMCGMFYYCHNLSSLNISGFDTSNVTNMQEMFCECSNLTSLNVTGFDTSKVTKMTSMFNKCYNLSSLDVSHFDTTNVIYMAYMFRDCSNLSYLDVSHFDTSKVEYMEYLFSGCSGLTEINVSNFNTSNVWDMKNMFDGCNNIIKLDLSNFNMQSIGKSGTAFMLQACSCLSEIKTLYNLPQGEISLPATYYDEDYNFYTTIPAITKSMTLKKAPADASSAKVTATNQTYTGKTLTPKATVFFHGKTIPTDNYTLSYKNNTNVGTAIVIAKFKGNYSGSASGTFQIKAPEVGDKVTTDNAVYQINENKEVTYVAPTNKTTTTITIPDTVKIGTDIYKVTQIKPSAVSNNKNVTTINIGKNVKKLKANTIKKCPKLRKITFRFNSVKDAKKCKVGKQKKINNKKRIKVKAIIRNRKAKTRKSRAFKKAYRKRLAKSFGRKAKISVVYSKR